MATFALFLGALVPAGIVGWISFCLMLHYFVYPERQLPTTTPVRIPKTVPIIAVILWVLTAILITTLVRPALAPFVGPRVAALFLSKGRPPFDIREALKAIALIVLGLVGHLVMRRLWPSHEEEHPVERLPAPHTEDTPMAFDPSRRRRTSDDTPR